MKCRFCTQLVTVDTGVVDIGGLKLCPQCYETRKARTHLPCQVCGKLEEIEPNPLIIAVACSDCQSRADLSGSYRRAYTDNPSPCDRCGKVLKPHHASVYGQNLCHGCYQELGEPCTQVYPGDLGYPPAFVSKPSIPVAVLPINEGIYRCVVCGVFLSDPASLVTRFGLFTICGGCEGPKWWAAMDRHRGGQG